MCSSAVPLTVIEKVSLFSCVQCRVIQCHTITIFFKSTREFGENYHCIDHVLFKLHVLSYFLTLHRVETLLQTSVSVSETWTTSLVTILSCQGARISATWSERKKTQQKFHLHIYLLVYVKIARSCYGDFQVNQLLDFKTSYKYGTKWVLTTFLGNNHVSGQLL